MTAAAASATSSSRRAGFLARGVDMVGLGSLFFGALILLLIGVGAVTGVAAIVALCVLGAALVGLVIFAIAGSPETRRRLAPYGLLHPGILWLALFFLVPLFTLLKSSLSSRPSRFAVEYTLDWNLDNYRTAFSSFGNQFQRGFGYAAVATVICICIAFPLAYVIAFRGGRWRTLLLGLVILPFFTSFLIRTIAWRSLLADRGPVLGVLKRLRLTGPLDAIGFLDNGRLLDTSWSVIGGLTYNFVPFMVLPIYVSLEKINPAVLDAAKDLYSGSVRTFMRVTLPLAIPGVFAGTLLTFIPAAGDFINAQYLGSPLNTMIGNSIENQFIVQNNVPLAAAMSFVLMALITVGVLIYTKFLGTEDLA